MAKPALHGTPLRHDHPVSVVLPESFQDRVRGFPETHAGVNTVTVTLTDGRVFSGVEVAWATEVIRVRGHTTIPFTAEEIADVDDASGMS